MDVFTAISQRGSVRAYKETGVEEDKLRKILEAARLSPSASEAPVVIVACGTETKSMMLCGQPAYTVDVSIACAFMILQAYELGLGTCWIGAFKEDAVKKILGIPEFVRVVAMFPLGYPNQPLSQRFRKDLDQIVCFEKYE